MPLGTPVIQNQGGKSASTPVFIDEITFTGDTAYPTGGSAAFEAFIRGATGIKEGRTVDAVIDVTGNATHYPVYDKAANALKMFVRATGVEVANTTNMSATTFRVLVISH